MKLVKHDMCTGCGACMEICPQTAIVFQEDSEGFPTPSIIAEKCIHCDLCTKVCPAVNSPERHAIQKAYAAQMLDRETLKDSTSGGLFTVFAREILRRKGVVYGCVWDEKYNAVVRRAEDEEAIRPMRGSKYVWSHAADTFPQVKQDLQDGRDVLFVGLPCQVAGLKNYLGKDYERLYLVDFFCGGAPSPKAFQAYLKTITADVPREKLDFKFRDKKKYGVGVHISYESKAGRVNQTYISNPYYFSFFIKVFNRRPCYQCQYRSEQRVEDLTIGDYWGIENYHKEFDIRAGVSTLLVNTDKGAALLNAVKDELQLVKTRVEDIAAGNNLSLNGQSVTYHAPAFRNAFMETMDKKGWKAAERKYLYNKTRLKLYIKEKLPSGVRKSVIKLLSRMRRV